ncbi:ComF family protein [Patescibacteria group bacterium]|nr:MAG: ComF family protein [Patescibacteria group bacterium]
MFFNKFLKTFFDFIFPIECVGCGKNGSFLCPGCSAKIKIIPVQTCHYCRKLRAFGKTCDQCLSKNRLDGLFILGPYDQPILKDAIHAWKHERVKEIGNILGLWAAKNLNSSLFQSSIIVPIPLHKQRQFDRGFNQSEQLSLILAQKFQIPAKTLLIKIKDTEPQSSLNREKRLLNIRGVFAPAKDAKLNGENIILIDDITTTGATMEEAAKTLKKSGAKSIFGLALAHGS